MPAKSARLNYGDTIGIVAPASPPPDPQDLDRAVAVLQRLGFRTRLAPHARQRWGFLAGTDRDRAGDLMKLFADRKVGAIMCLRGGYGSARLLPLLDYRAIRTHAKIFIGHSDITALHCALLTKAGLVSFHGPMLNADFTKADLPDFTLQSFLKTLMQPAAPGGMWDDYNKGITTILRRGVASGPLVGGNLTLLCAMLGTPYQPSFRSRIFFFEDLNEAPYRFDRKLTQLLQAGLLQQVAGIAIGINAHCQDPAANRPREYRQSLLDVFRERLLPLKVPIVMGLPFGHIPLNATLPLGVCATLDAVKGDLIITEPAVR